MKTLNDYQIQKVDYLKGKLAYHRAGAERGGAKKDYHMQKVRYALSKLAYMGYQEEGAEV